MELPKNREFLLLTVPRGELQEVFMVLVLFTVRDRKLRKLGVGRTIETARADAARQILRHIKEDEKFFLEQSVIYLQRGWHLPRRSKIYKDAS